MRLCTATCTRIQWSNKKSWANKPPEYIAVSCIQTRWCQPTKQSFKCAGLGHLVLESFLGSSPIAANAWGKNYHLFTSSVFFGQKQNGRNNGAIEYLDWPGYRLSWPSTGTKVLLPPTLEKDRCASHAPRRCNVFRICMKWGKPNTRSPPLAWQFPGQPSFNILRPKQVLHIGWTVVGAV